MTKLEHELSKYLDKKQVTDGVYIMCITNKSVVCANVCVKYTSHVQGGEAIILDNFPFHSKPLTIHGYTYLQEVILTHQETKMKGEPVQC